MEGSRPKRFRPLAQRFSIVTTVVLAWVVTISLVWDLNTGHLDWRKAVVLAGVVGGVGLAISRFSIRVLGRPLELLERGITSVGEGKLELIQVSPTKDEIESLGQSFNRMIRALAASQEQIRQHQELLEERIRERTAELETAMQGALVASRAKSEFLANMSHELRTPMNGLLGMLDLVLDGPIEGEDRENIEVAQRCAYSLLGLLNDILDLSKIEAGRMQLERVPCNIRSVIEECLRPHTARAQQKGIDLQFACLTSEPVTVAGDPVRLRQIVNNLVSNALKFTEAGTVRVTMFLKELSERTSTLVLEVSDTGTGIPDDKLNLIFDKFTQADSSTTRKYGGTGLGLAITQKLIQLHGGVIRVESELGKGSHFTVELPYEILQEEHPAPAPPPPAAPPEPVMPSPHLLLVEDNPVNQRVALAMLRKKGYRIDVANNGQEALEAIRNTAEPYHLILMDVQMPVLDGLAATRAIRNGPIHPRIPIIAMTAHAMAGDRDRCLSAGMSDYLSKPLQAVTLIATIEKQLSRARALPTAPAAPAQIPAQAVLSVPPPAQAPVAPSMPALSDELIRGMLQLFLHAAPERLRKMEAALLAKDGNRLTKEAHAIRSAAKQLGHARLADCAGRLEAAAQRGDFVAVSELAEQLRQEFDALAPVAA